MSKTEDRCSSYIHEGCMIACVYMHYQMREAIMVTTLEQVSSPLPFSVQALISSPNVYGKACIYVLAYVYI